MTTPRKQRHPTQPAKRKRGDQLHPDVKAAIERAWPDGVIEMSFDSEESWFWDVHPKLAKAFHSLKGARLLNERSPESVPMWSYDDDDEDPASEYVEEFPRSYHLFFISPEAAAFTFETEIETTADPEYEEETGEPFDGELEIITVAGRGHIGWAVAVSLIAPVAVIALSDYSVYEDGAVSEPAIGRYGQDEDGKTIHPDTHFLAVHGQKLFRVLEKLRSSIETVLKKRGVTVLPEAEWSKEVPWLRGDGEVFVGGAEDQPVRVLDAFFFEGL